MIKRMRLLAVLAVLTGPALAQNIGDQSMARYTTGRTGLNSDAGMLAPPLIPSPSDMVTLTGFDSADSLTVFGDFFLVGQGGSPTTYTLFERDGTPVWTSTINSNEDPLDYGPAFANDIVLIGGPATSTVKAIRVSTGAELWSDSSIGQPVGSSQGRHPVIIDNLAVFHGRDRVVAANASTGAVIWFKTPGTTAEAPLALASNRVFVGGTLRAYRLRTGVLLWTQNEAFGGDGSDLIATEKYVFQTDTATGQLRASRSSNGTVLWTAATDGSFGDPGIALAYDRLYAFFSDGDGIPTVRAYNPDTGDQLWERKDPSNREDGTGTIEFASIANNVIYYYNDPGTGLNGRLRAMDAFSGNTIWSLPMPDRMRALSIADGRLYALFDEMIRVFNPMQQAYFAQYADGGVISTLLTVNNLGGVEANGMIELFTSVGGPMEIDSEQRGSGSSFPITIPANESVRLQSTAGVANVRAGWARVTLDQPVSGSAIFQINDLTTFTFEAGVANSGATGLGTVFARRFELPSGDGFGTGVAMANVVNETATIQLEFRPAGGGAVVETDPIELGAGNQIARFLSELFEGLGDDVEGTLVITSDVPVVITALRTKNGFPFSSYPVGQRP